MTRKSRSYDRTVESYRQALQAHAPTSSTAARPRSPMWPRRRRSSRTRSLRPRTSSCSGRRAEHAIACLRRREPLAFQCCPGTPLPLDVVPPPIDPGLPSALLERRPDVAEAERQVAAANAQIGVARAAYFPRLTSNAAGGSRAPRPPTCSRRPASSGHWGRRSLRRYSRAVGLVAETARVKGGLRGTGRRLSQYRAHGISRRRGQSRRSSAACKKRARPMRPPCSRPDMTSSRRRTATAPVS